MEAHNRIARCAALIALILGPVSIGRAQGSPGAPALLPELAIVVVDSLGGGQRQIDNYNRNVREFTDAIESRNWPVR